MPFSAESISVCAGQSGGRGELRRRLARDRSRLARLRSGWVGDQASARPWWPRRARPWSRWVADHAFRRPRWSRWVSLRSRLNASAGNTATKLRMTLLDWRASADDCGRAGVHLDACSRPPRSVEIGRHRGGRARVVLRGLLLAGATGAPEGVGVAPGVGVEVDGVAVLGEAVDQGADARGVVERRGPRLVSEVGCDHDGASLVSAADDVEEQVGGAAVARDLLDERGELRVAVLDRVERTGREEA